MPDDNSKRVLILGGGFAGLEAAETLEKIFSEKVCNCRRCNE